MNSFIKLEKEIYTIIEENKLLKKDYSSVPRKTLELIEEAEKNKNQ